MTSWISEFSSYFDLLLICIRYAIYSLADSLSYLSKEEILKQNTIFDIIIKGSSTGFGIVLGNLIINYIKHKNHKNDISKIFGLAIQTQIDDFYNIKKYIDEIKKIFITHYNTITNPPGTQNNLQSIKRERGNILNYIEKTKNLENTVRTSYIFNLVIDSVKVYKSNELTLINRYLRQIKIILEDLKIFYSFELPNSTIKFDDFQWRTNDFYKERVDSIKADVDIFFCLCFMVKEAINSFGIDEKIGFESSYERISSYLVDHGFAPLDNLDIRKFDNLILHSQDSLKEIQAFKLSNRTYKRIKN